MVKILYPHKTNSLQIFHMESKNADIYHKSFASLDQTFKTANILCSPTSSHSYIDQY